MFFSVGVIFMHVNRCVYVPGDRRYVNTDKKKSCHGGKNGKERLTVMTCANLDGSEKMNLMVIGKFRNPRCFKNVNSLPVDYRWNKKAWMTSELFSEWVRKLDRKMERKHGKIILFEDNCTAHPKLEHLTSVKLAFFPPNTTSILQPMDQGVIYNLKYRYRTRLIKRYLDNLEKKRETEVNVLMAIHTVYGAWQELTKNCIHNCFVKAGFPPSGPKPFNIGNTSDDEDDIPLSYFLQWNSIPKDRDMSLEEYVAIDDSVVTSHGLDDEEILASVSDKNDTGNESDDSVECETTCNEPVRTETAYQCVETLRKYICSTENAPQELFSSLSAFESYFEKVSVKKQIKITDCFKKI